MRSGREIALGPLVAAAGAVLLIVSLFLDWYGPFTAFTIFEVLDLLLLALALASLLALAELFGAVREGTMPLEADAALPLGVVALVIVGSQLINHPPAGVDRDPEIGAWLALGGAALLVLGSVLSVARIHLDIDVDRRRRRSAAAPDPDAPTATEPAAPGSVAEPPADRPDPERPI
jgi:hypothetical protein